MLYINENKIEDLLLSAKKASKKEFEAILKKTGLLKRLTLSETAVLLSREDPKDIKKITEAASRLKERIYGKRIVLFAPLYISNRCANNCLYCAFKSDNARVKRKTLSSEEIKDEVLWLLKRGHKRVLLVAGEAASAGKTNIDYYVDAVRAVYSVNFGAHKIKRANINCAPLSVAEFKKLKKAQIGTYQLFQETYHEATYRHVHPKGPKSDPDNRIDAIDRAFLAGIDDIGIGVLYGLYDYKFETLAMLMHVEHMEEKFKVGPHTISVPRIEPALGSDYSVMPPYAVSDSDFKKVVSVLRLSVPYTGLILTTRETPEMRDELFGFGISQISAESQTSPAGYSTAQKDRDTSNQFFLNDHRTLEEISATLIEKGFIPSFCAACYRKERTGRAFMNLAKPGLIKGKCSVNALITLKEYLDDFAGDKLKKDGYKLINKMKKQLEPETQAQLSDFFKDIDGGIRDRYI